MDGGICQWVGRYPFLTCDEEEYFKFVFVGGFKFAFVGAGVLDGPPTFPEKFVVG